MKCQSNLKYAFHQKLLVFLLSSCSIMSLSAVDDIDTMQEKIRNNLSNQSPDVIVVFDNHAREIESILLDFLNRQNHDSVSIFVERFTRVLLSFKQQVVEHPGCSAVKNVAHDIYRRYMNLVGILNRYSNKRDGAFSMINDLKGEIDLVPQTLRTRYGGLTLVGSLSHRLRCNRA